MDTKSVVKPAGILAAAALFILLFVPLVKVPPPPAHWQKAEFDRVYPVVHDLMKAYRARLVERDIIPDKRIVMKSFDSTVRRSVLGTFKIGTTRTSTVILDYVRAGDAEGVFPTAESEHVVTPDNVDAFKAWLKETVEKMDSQAIAPDDSAPRADGESPGVLGQ